MNEETLDFLLNYDYSEIEKIPGHIEEISTTQKLILEEIQKEPEEVQPDLSEEETDEPLETVEEVSEEIEMMEVMSIEAEDQTEYMKLVYEELQTQNVLLQDIANDSNDMLQEGFLMVVMAIVITIGVKVFIDQISKW